MRIDWIRVASSLHTPVYGKKNMLLRKNFFVDHMIYTNLPCRGDKIYSVPPVNELVVCRKILES